MYYNNYLAKFFVTKQSLSFPHVVRAGLGDEKIIAIHSIGVVVPRRAGPRDA